MLSTKLTYEIVHWRRTEIHRSCIYTALMRGKDNLKNRAIWGEMIGIKVHGMTSSQHPSVMWISQTMWKTWGHGMEEDSQSWDMMVLWILLWHFDGDCLDLSVLLKSVFPPGITTEKHNWLWELFYFNFYFKVLLCICQTNAKQPP